MEKFKINKTFPNLEACEEWENANIIDNEYKGHTVLMVAHEESVSSPEVTITEITCF